MKPHLALVPLALASTSPILSAKIPLYPVIPEPIVYAPQFAVNESHYLTQAGYFDFWSRTQGIFASGDGIHILQLENGYADTSLTAAFYRRVPENQLSFFYHDPVSHPPGNQHANQVARVLSSELKDGGAEDNLPTGFAMRLPGIHSQNIGTFRLDTLRTSPTQYTKRRPGELPIPPDARVRVINMSSTFGNGGDAGAMRGIDYLAHHSDILVCAAQTSFPLNETGSSTLWNSIAVGKASSNLSHAGGTVHENTAAGPRQKPDLVTSNHYRADGLASSFTTPVVSSMAAALFSYAETADLSKASHAVTIKAILMAGASKASTAFTGDDATPDGRVVWENSESKPLDIDYGAGHANIDNAYAIIQSQGVAKNGNALPSGWSHDSLSTTGERATYDFTISASDLGEPFCASLAWNRAILPDPNDNEDYIWDNADLDLTLYQLDALGTETPVVSSKSKADNVEHLWLAGGLTAGNYRLTVTNVTPSSVIPVTEYGFAWRTGSSASAVRAPVNYASWKSLVFSPTEQANAAVSDPNSDPDQDGVSNLVEYAFSDDPMRTHDFKALTLTESFPTQIAFLSDPSKADLTWTLQSSSTLASPDWRDVPTTSTTINAHGTQHAASVSELTNHFFRLKITATP